MGTQRKYERMPLPPVKVASRPYPILWDTRAKVMAHDRRMSRNMISKLTGAELSTLLNFLRVKVAGSYPATVMYRAALHEAVVSRHWTVTWSALTNTHTIK